MGSKREYRSKMNIYSQILGGISGYLWIPAIVIKPIDWLIVMKVIGLTSDQQRHNQAMWHSHVKPQNYL